MDIDPRDWVVGGQEQDAVADYEEIDLQALNDEELVEQMHNDLYDGMRDEIVDGTKILLERGFTATKVLDDARFLRRERYQKSESRTGCAHRTVKR
jgi:hypothetical protein